MLFNSQATRSVSASVTTISALLLLLAANAVPVTLRNDVPRVDNTGNIISAGDGCISYHPDEQLYYLFGAHYQPCHEPNTDCYAGADGLKPCQTHEKVDAGLCCGWRNATIAAWSSPDLSAWTLEGLNILPVLTSNSSVYSSEYMAIFEPCGVFNRKTGFWSLFFLRDGYVLARAVARTAAGPFDVLQWNVPVPGMDRIVDFYFWQNASTGDLIMKHNSESAGEYAVTFSDDYLNITGTSQVMGHELGYTEGGGIFQYGGHTFLMAGYGCCFCTDGSNGFLWRADFVLGNYTLLGDKIPRYANHTSVTHAQQFSVTPVYTRDGVIPMFVGIRFGSAPDFIKSHDYQYWAPLPMFRNAQGELDMHNVTWLDSFTLDLEAPPPPPPVTPPAPWYVCSLTNLGACAEVPPFAPGAVATLSECEAQCAPVYTCNGADGCAQAPAGTPGGVATLAECTALCVECNLSGLWYGSAKGVRIYIEQMAVNASYATAKIWTVPSVWVNNATGWVTPGLLTVTGAWCVAGRCEGSVSPLESGGANCGSIDWGDDGIWCSAALEPAKCTGT